MAKEPEFGTETDPGYDKVKSKQEHSEKAKNVLRGAGYARGGGVSPKRHEDAKEDRALIKKELSHAKIKVKHGGKIEGKKAHHRADKFARGGSAPKGHGTRVNINMGASQADKQDAMKKGVALGAQLAAHKMAGAMGGPRPGAGAPMQARGPMPGAPVPGPGPGSMTPGGPPPMANRGGRFAKGGKIKGVAHLTGGAGAGGAAGRLAKIKSYGGK